MKNPVDLILDAILLLLLDIKRLLHPHHHHHRLARPQAPKDVKIRLVTGKHHHQGHKVMKAKITWTDATTRTDGKALAASEIAFIDVQLSADNGQNYASVGHAASGQQTFEQELTDPGTYLFKLETVDTQTPAKTSVDSAIVSVTVPEPALAAPNAPTNVAASLS